MSIAVVLLIGGGLFLRTLSNLIRVDPGFEPRHVLTMRLFVPNPSAAKRADFEEQLLQDVGTLPDVQAAGTIHPAADIAAHAGELLNGATIERDGGPAARGPLTGAGFHLFEGDR